MIESIEDIEFKAFLVSRELQAFLVSLEHRCHPHTHSGGLAADNRLLQKALILIRLFKAQSELLQLAIDAGGWDMSPCGRCGIVIVCLPDGLPMCEKCAMSE